MKPALPYPHGSRDATCEWGAWLKAKRLESGYTNPKELSAAFEGLLTHEQVEAFESCAADPLAELDPQVLLAYMVLLGTSPQEFFNNRFAGIVDPSDVEELPASIARWMLHFYRQIFEQLLFDYTTLATQIERERQAKRIHQAGGSLEEMGQVQFPEVGDLRSGTPEALTKIRAMLWGVRIEQQPLIALMPHLRAKSEESLEQIMKSFEAKAGFKSATGQASG